MALKRTLCYRSVNSPFAVSLLRPQKALSKQSPKFPQNRNGMEAESAAAMATGFMAVICDFQFTPKRPSATTTLTNSRRRLLRCVFGIFTVFVPLDEIAAVASLVFKDRQSVETEGGAREGGPKWMDGSGTLKFNYCLLFRAGCRVFASLAPGRPNANGEVARPTQCPSSSVMGNG